MSAYAAWIITDILSDRSSRFVGFGPAPALATPFASMFKTGTANQFQHIWALGATKRYTVGVWMGNFSGETVIGSTGSSIPARIASRLLSVLEDSDGKKNLGRSEGSALAGENLSGPMPVGVLELRICTLSGMSAGPHCTGFAREWIRNDRVPQRCTWHSGGGLFYPLEYQAWLNERFRSGSVSGGGSGRIRNPVPGSVYFLDPSISLETQALRIETNGFISGAMVYSNGMLQGSLNHAGVYALPLSRGHHFVLVEDSAGASASVNFEVR
jgi:penicillin-binding protein 1C